MKYTVDKSVFELNPDMKFGILIGNNIKNSKTTLEDEERLRKAEIKMRDEIKVEEIRNLRNVSLYREVMRKSGINPNKYPPSVEAMFKRIIKGGQLPVINSLVDLCNAISIERGISLGGHDLIDINEDLEVRYSKKRDVFLPFGSENYEEVQEGELIFTSGNIVQTLKWVWRQSELGKVTLDSSDVFFQLVGFGYEQCSSLYEAMNDIEDLIKNRFQGSCRRYLVDINNPSIEF
ncbi:B3/B4 domain-containing protein [Sedimentibacter sp. MB31-C6]|uniref:B3/B4 domain-containing protein n=1 Tax=Sedimentibacter sp. MB31-C6 TaxID=3109366 RepID=UPI002DDD17B7|nr:phenylalanine--tRNA ligase beta subunit-related protein [Sedimentibacter sp. MB36-C1]WSI03654.1 phenylalanine--tRNA ligase beta subunit-related protein [Sedimentibacter sp. MB36-C1]